MKYDPALEAGLKSMRGGAMLKDAAKQAGVSRERLSRYVKTQASAGRSGRSWTFNDRRARQVQVIHNGEVIEVWVEGYEPARLAGAYMGEAGHVIENPHLAPRFRRRWDNTTIKAKSGKRYAFTTDLNEIYRAIHANDRPFHEIYRLSMAQ
jgi:hypothetical protein